MATLRVQTRIEHASGIRENDVTNTLHFNCADADAVPGDATVLAIVQAVKDFYTVAHTAAGAAGGTSLKSHMSSELSIGANHVFYTKVYNLEDAQPRVPIHDERWASAVSGAGTGLPSECALVASYSAARVSGANMARRRGRLFFGPIKASSAALGAQSVVRPVAALIESLVGAMAALKIASDADATWLWCVWSPTDAGFYPVTNGWVDDSFDTQRRRGADATQKTLF